MSRIGKSPISLPSGVTVNLKDSGVTVKGGRGELQRALPDGISIALKDDQIEVLRSNDERRCRSLHGLMRTLVANMVEGVSNGFAKELELHGVGYRGQIVDDNLVLRVGFSHEVVFSPPSGISIAVNSNRIRVEGNDKELVGDVAARIRRIRPPDHYKGKGIRYVGEKLRLKPGKAGKVAK